ncbi:MAG: hypothetical protein ACI4TW_08020 [Prevotella sp.]
MKTTLIFKAALSAAMLCLCSINTASAKSWRINNDTRMKANFVGINEAMGSAEVLNGDTLYLDPGCVLTSTQTITKSVTIIGPGYFLQNGMVPSRITAGLNCSAEGIKLTGVIMEGSVYIKANYITLERCMIKNDVYSYNTAGWYGLSVIQCYLRNSTNSVTLQGNFSNATIKNNIICHCCANYSVIKDVHESEISNNYILMEHNTNTKYCLQDITNSQIYNNIIINKAYPDNVFANSGSDNNNGFYNNVISAAEGAYSNVTDIVYLGTGDTSTIFADGDNDEIFRLKDDSPAKGVATDGGDCGPHGGATPYVESGLPLYHPFISEVTVSAKPVNGKINLKLKAKMQNE